jgi:hypothetical protein
MDQGRQRRDQVDAAVVQDVRGQCRSAPASCARQFLADTGDAGADHRPVADKLEGEADQDRREGGEPRPLCRLSDGRGRHPTANVPGDLAADRGTTAAATTSAGVRAVRTSRSSCRKAGKTRIFSPVQESSGESWIEAHSHASTRPDLSSCLMAIGCPPSAHTSLAASGRCSTCGGGRES